MEESEEILINSLANSGVLISPDVSSIQGLTPAMLTSITAQSLRLIDNTLSFCPILPESSMAERYKICTDLASAIKNLGYVADINFHTFLYPSEEDKYKLVRFFVRRLSESSVVEKSSSKKDINPDGIVEERSFVSATKDALVTVPGVPNSIPEKSGRVTAVYKEISAAPVSTEECGDSRNISSDNGELSSKMRHDVENLQIQEKSPVKEMSRKSQVRNFEEDQELLKAGAEMACEEHLVDFCSIQQIQHADAREHNLVVLDSQGNTDRNPLEEKNRCLQEGLCTPKLEPQEKLQNLKEIELEIQAVISETKEREEELLKHSTDLEKQPKLASRKSYIDRVKEITKNSRKQDTDMERILNETRELQLESNSIQERLNRTYAVVDETIFREAKKDPVGRQAYRLLTSIHETFEQISEKILATDRTRREAADHEAKLAAMASQSLKIDKLQADLDAIRLENEFLEQLFHNSLN